MTKSYSMEIYDTNSIYHKLGIMYPICKHRLKDQFSVNVEGLVKSNTTFKENPLVSSGFLLLHT